MLKFFGRGNAFADQHTSAYFVDGNDLIIIDCSVSSFQRLNNRTLSQYDHIYVLVTHTHGDHVSGIGLFIDLMHFALNKPVTIVAPNEAVKTDLRYLLKNLEGCGDDWYELLTADELDKDWFGCAIPTFHSEELEGKCFGYYLTVEGNKVVYTGDTGIFEPYEKYMEPGVYLYTEISARKTPVHLSCSDMHDRIKELVASGVHVYLMHMDYEDTVLNTMKDTGAFPAPLDEAELTLESSTQLLNNILSISDHLYKDMCMNGSHDHNMLFTYLTELGKMSVDADRASFWKWDKRKSQLWTMSATGIDKIIIPDNTGLVGKALRMQQTLITNDPYSDPDFNRDIDIQTGYKTRSVMVLPVADINGKFIGALQLINKNDERGFDADSDPKRLSLAALVCGIALESETFLEDSHHDRLTGLKNRMGFYFDFNEKYKDYLIPGSGKSMSIFICDIDKFKRVNDTYGHNAGDDVLRFTSELVESCCGENDGVYRWGGEEFVMVMRDTDLEGAVAKAEEIRVKLMNTDIEADGNTLRCTLSFGCSVFDPEKTIEENISTADEHLYNAKETGRNKVCY